MDLQTIKEKAMKIRAVNNPVRQDILNLLAGGNEMTVTDIMFRLRIDQAICSQHLRTLRDSGLVKSSKDGKYRRYKIKNKRLMDLYEAIRSI